MPSNLCMGLSSLNQVKKRVVGLNIYIYIYIHTNLDLHTTICTYMCVCIYIYVDRLNRTVT